MEFQTNQPKLCWVCRKHNTEDKYRQVKYYARDMHWMVSNRGFSTWRLPAADMSLLGNAALNKKSVESIQCIMDELWKNPSTLNYECVNVLSIHRMDSP